MNKNDVTKGEVEVESSDIADTGYRGAAIAQSLMQIGEHLALADPTRKELSWRIASILANDMLLKVVDPEDASLHHLSSAVGGGNIYLCEAVIPDTVSLSLIESINAIESQVSSHLCHLLYCVLPMSVALEGVKSPSIANCVLSCVEEVLGCLSGSQLTRAETLRVNVDLRQRMATATEVLKIVLRSIRLIDTFLLKQLQPNTVEVSEYAGAGENAYTVNPYKLLPGIGEASALAIASRAERLFGVLGVELTKGEATPVLKKAKVAKKKAVAPKQKVVAKKVAKRPVAKLVPTKRK